MGNERGGSAFQTSRSGSINAMVYLRGSEADFRMWEVPGWGWSDVVPAFERLERVLDVRPRPPTAFTEACIASAEEAGFLARLGARLHLLICRHCRRFRRELILIGKAARLLARSPAAPEGLEARLIARLTRAP